MVAGRNQRPVDLILAVNSAWDFCRLPFLRLVRGSWVGAGVGVIISDGGFGVWQARIPEPGGERVISRYTLRELLDKLDELTGEHRSQPDSGQA